MATTNPDIIVLDEEKWSQIKIWGRRIGDFLGLEVYELEDQYFDYIPQYINYLRFDYKTGTFGHKYWGEYRSERSEYGENEEGTTQKDKVSVDSTLQQKYTLPFMKQVITLAVQEVFEKRYQSLRATYSSLEDATWGDQLAESQAYLADSDHETKLIHRLAELRGLTTEQFAGKVVEKQGEWKEKLFDLAVAEQTLIVKLKAITNVADVNVFLEDYFGISMSNQQCLNYGRCIENEDGLIVRKEPFKYGIRF